MQLDSWQIKTVFELGHRNPGTVQTGPFGSQLHADDYVEDGVPFILIRNIGQNGLILDDMPRITEKDAQRLKRYALKAGDIVFSRVGRVGSCFLATGEHEGWLISGQTLRIRLPSDNLNLEYILYSLRNKETQDFIAGASVGTTRSSINTEILQSLPVQLPPLPEQNAIASVLAAVDRAIEQTEALIAKYQRIKTGLLHDLLTRGIDKHGQLRDPATHNFKPSPLGLVPEEWEVATVKRLFTMDLGKMLSKAAKIGKSPKPYLGNKNVQWGWVDVSDLETMDFSIEEQNRLRLKRHDILICEGGEVGRAALWNDELDECYFQKAIHRLRPAGGYVSPQFMLYYMQFAVKRGLLQILTSQTSIAHLTQEKLAELPICHPKPDEMAQIVATLEQQVSTIRVEEERLTKLQKLKTGLMQDLLTGKVSVAALLNP